MHEADFPALSAEPAAGALRQNLQNPTLVPRPDRSARRSSSQVCRRLSELPSQSSVIIHPGSVHHTPKCFDDTVSLLGRAYTFLPSEPLLSYDTMGVIGYKLSVAELGRTDAEACSSCGSFDLATLGSSATVADLQRQILDCIGESCRRAAQVTR
jgi:hypothetical protein